MVTSCASEVDSEAVVGQRICADRLLVGEEEHPGGAAMVATVGSCSLSTHWISGADVDGGPAVTSRVGTCLVVPAP